MAKISLLRLNQEPIWLASYQFELNAQAIYPFPQQVGDRRLELLRLGLTQQELLQCLGAPDYIRDEWEYDFLTDGEALTARVHFEKSGETYEQLLERFRQKIVVDDSLKVPPKVAQVEILAPQWRTITMRDRCLLH